MHDTCRLKKLMPAPRGRCSPPINPATTELGWVYKYPEKKEVKSGNPWVIRHTGVYHVYNIKDFRSTLVIVNPSPIARFSQYLRKMLQQSSVRSTILSTPTIIHTMLISSHLESWRDYLEDHEALLLKLDMKPACTVLEEPLVTFDTLKEVRAIEKRILPVEPLLTSFDELVHDLQRAGDHLSKKVLDSLNLGFQQLAKGQSQNTFQMARSAREDSVAIRAITLVTSFYLPFSFVATMFGMNLVDFDSESRNLLVSKQLWLYFVISVPLTVMTLACWRWRMQTYRRSYLEEESSSLQYDKSTDNTSEMEMV
ncbi:hypothetical protein BU25DRAFT_483274 [Macroventuria anomochaeta]|uniref:Uncharacterized protein n=1 Tax=Macroventuria anomochaeta TaxID=301207 RepID=A0ACB6RH57_9PLEO|nr:uncharacterized protein BU25DRAFT_483274 [Macroventuria anomochaeta]KAF2621211.1 hypothetical protein BU25DRAFT_483274 [Macroventuria anomochaeta]